MENSEATGSCALEVAVDALPLATASGGIIRGTVQLGDQRGRLLGFPTANLYLGASADIRDGVYAGTFHGGSARNHVAAISIGRRPTVYEDGVRLVEAHLLDFDDDLYGVAAAVELFALLRPQSRFATLDLLREQLARDVELTARVMTTDARLRAMA